MKHLKSFDQINESLINDKIKSFIQKLETKDTKSIIELLLPYKSLLKPYYDKYYIDGVIDADLIDADIRKFNFTAKTNEGWTPEYDENNYNPFILRILYKVFYKFPKEVIQLLYELISEFIKDIISDFKGGWYADGIIKSFRGLVVAFLVWILGLFAYQCADYIFNGLDKGVSVGGAEFEPAHYERRSHTYRSGKTTHTYYTREFVPDRWHVEVKGIEDKERVEKWVTYDKNIGEGVWKGDTLVNDKDWTWEWTE
jgi:hypothetical protein